MSVKRTRQPRGDTGATGAAAPFIGCHVTNSADVTITDNVETVVTFDTERYDEGGFHDNVTNNSRLTIPVSGYYHVAVGLRMNTPSTGWTDLEVNIYMNGNGAGANRISSANPIIPQPPIAAPICSFRVNTGVDYYFVAGDYVEVYVFSALSTPASTTVDRQLNSTPEFYIRKIG